MGLGHVKDLLEADGIAWGGPSRKLVAVLVAFAADRKGICRATQVELSEQAGISPRQVANILDDLCGDELLARLGHGRYGVRYGLGTEERRVQGGVMPKGAMAEYKRLSAVVKEEKAAGQHVHKVVWPKDGMPVLVER